MKIRFGAFTIDSGTRQLLRGGEEVHVSPKAFDLLAALVAERPRVVSKQELFARIWPGTFVGEANLNVVVGEVRRALGDNARTPRFVRTVHGVGYAFCGDAKELEEAEPARGATRFWLEAKDRSYTLDAEENTVGRDPRCDVRLNDASVSRRHARIRISPGTGTAVLEDLGSTNGTFVGPARVEAPTPRDDGQRIMVGSVELTFHAGAEALAPTRRVRAR